MPAFNIDAGTVLGLIVLFAMRFLVLENYAKVKQDWQKWMLAAAVGLAVNVSVKVFFG